MAFTRVLGPGIHTASNINSHNINSTGIITAVSFVGNGAGLTGIASTDNIITGTAATFNTYPVDINAGMDVVGVSSFQDIDVDGHTNLDNVSVAGVTTFSDDVTFTGDSYNLTWDKSDNKLKFAEYAGIRLGNNNELQIDHRGYSYILNIDSSPLVIGSSTLQLTDASTLNNLIYANTNSVRLYQNNVEKLRTKDYGIQVTGTTDTDGLIVSGVSTFTGAIDANGDLDVDGHTNLDNVSVGGATTMSGDLMIDSPSGQGLITIKGTSPRIAFTDKDHNPDYRMGNSNGQFFLYDVSNGKNRFTVYNNTFTIPNGTDLDVDGHTNLDNVSIAGVTTFAGGISGSTANLTGALTGTTANFSGNVTVGGVLTYEDVKNVDSIGIATARAGLNVSGGNVTIANDIDVDGHTNLDNVSVAGVSTFANDVIFDNALKILYDASNSFFRFGDNVKAGFGNNGDLEIYHTGTGSIINDAGTGTLHLRVAGSNRINVEANGVKLFYQGNEKLEITSTGINVTGNVVGDGLTIDGNSDLNGDLDVDGHTNLDNVSIAGVTTTTEDIIIGADNKKLKLGAGEELQIYQSGNHSIIQHNGSHFLSLRSNAFIVQDAAATKTIFYGDPNGQSSLYFNGSKKLETINGGVDITGNLQVDGFHCLGPINLDSDIDVEGHTNLDNVSIAGVTTITQDLDVDGHTNLDNLSVAGVSTFNDNVRLLDGDRLQFGNSQDISIFHNGNHTYINKSGSGTGNLYFNIDQVSFLNTTGTKSKFDLFSNGTSVIYHDGSERFRTTDKGIQVGTGVTVETNGQATFTGIVTATSFKLANGSDVGTGAGGTWSTYTAGIATSKSVGVNTSTLDDNDLVGVGNSFQGLYISNGMIIHDNTLSGNHYIGTAFNGLMAGPVNIEGTLSVDGNYVVV